MLVLLPPSETKRDGGDGPPLRLDALGSPGSRTAAPALVDELVELAADVPASRGALGLSPAQDVEIARNAALRSAPTLPAITGTPASSTTPWTSVRCAGPPRPGPGPGSPSARRCSGCCAPTTRCPATGSPRRRRCPVGRRWPPAGSRLLEPVLAAIGAGELVVDLRSGSYAALGRLPGAVRVEVLAEHVPTAGAPWSATSTRRTRAGWPASLASTRAEPADAAAVAAVARRAGLRVERRGPALTVVLCVRIRARTRLRSHDRGKFRCARGLRSARLLATGSGVGAELREEGVCDVSIAVAGRGRPRPIPAPR